MSSDLYIDGFPDSTRDYDKHSETVWIGHRGTCGYFGYDLTDKIIDYVHRNCFMYNRVKFLTDEQTGEVYSDYYNQLRSYDFLSDNDHCCCNEPMTVEDVEELVKIFDELHQHWQHLNSLTDEEFDALGYGYMRPSPEKVKEDIYSGEEIRESLLEFVGMYWSTRCD